MRRRNPAFSFLLVLFLTSVLGGCSGRSPQGRYDRFLADGKKMIERQDYARAALQFKNAVQLMPSDPEARYQLGLATLGMQDLRGAMVLFEEAHQLSPEHIGAQLKLAELMSSTGDPELLEDSEKRVESVLSLAPGSSDALDLLALDELKLGRAASAEEYLRQSLQSNPGQVQVYQKLASLAVARNDLDGAEKSLKQGIDASPRSVEPRLFLGEFYVFARRMSDAEAQFQMAVKLNPQSAAALLDLGRVQMENGDTVTAERTFERASRLPDKKYRSVHAIFLWSQGKTEAAIREFANLAGRDTEDRRARSRLVAAYLATKNRPEALRILRDALKSSPDDLDALVQRSEIYLDENSVAEAEGDLHQAVRLAPYMATVHYLLSRVFKARGQESLRRQALYQAIQLDPSLLAARVELADTFIAQPRVALELMNAVPREQAHSLPAIVMRNWGLLAAGDLTEAQKGISEGLAQSKTPELTLQTAVLKLKLHDLKGSRLALEEVLRREPGNLRALRALANSFFSAKDETTAIAKVKEHAAQQPDSAPVQEYLGEVLLIAGDQKGARAAFLNSRNVDPSYQAADLGLALMDSTEGNLDSARQILHRLMKGKNPNSLAAVRLAIIEESSHNYLAAIDAFRTALDTRTDDWVSLNDLAYCLILVGQTDEALKYAQEAREIAPDNPSVIDTLGWALYNKGLYDAAIHQLELLKSDPAAAHRYHLAMAYFKRGDIVRGQGTFNAALKIDPNCQEAIKAREIAAEATRAAQGPH